MKALIALLIIILLQINEFDDVSFPTLKLQILNN